MAILSQRGYAKHRGVVLSAVQKAIQTMRISTLPDGQIDSEQADREWEQNTVRRVASATGRDDEGGASQYAKARAVREHYQARLAKLEYEERVATLVPKDEVEVAAFNKYRVFRDSMLNIPDRVAALLAAETEPARVHQLLTEEIRRALQEFTDASH